MANNNDVLTVGTRHDLSEDYLMFETAGEYGKNANGVWYMRVPDEEFGMGSLEAHKVREHEDGTITVSPSIMCIGPDRKKWHGYLEKGVWRQINK